MRSVPAIVVALVAAVSVAVATEAPAAAADHTQDVALVLVVGGLASPVDLAAPPGDDRLFVVEKAGRIRIIEDGVLLADPFIDLTGPVNASANERGLLGVAFDPDYADNGRFYVNYTADSGSGDSIVASYEVSAADPNRADPSSGRVLLRVDQPYTNHNGGQVAVGPDGYLYASFGDGGSGNDPGNNGQNKNTLLGSIVRIDPETGAAAPGNPFVNVAGADEIWAYGLRNPWRFAFDPITGDMFIGDVGQDAWEEIDRIPAGTGGLNFGWKIREGAHCRVPGCDPTGLVDPIVEYAHGADPCSASVTGGYVYRGRELPGLQGHYFYADFCKGSLRSFKWDGAAVTEATNWGPVLDPPRFVTSFGVDGFGELYLLAGGTVYRFTSTAPPACDFNADGDADLAVGSPGEKLSGAAAAGTVHVFPGHPSGLDPALATRMWQGNGGIQNRPERGDAFGAALQCGDFNGDGFGDLAVGAPGERRLGRPAAGVVHVVFGSAAGLSGSDDEVWHQDSVGVPNRSERRDRFGETLAVGDFNGDGFDDLAVGVPGERLGGDRRAGGVQLLYGARNGLLAGAGTFLHQDAGRVKEEAEAGDRFGAALAAGDFDGDGVDDLAVGVPGELVDGVDGGMVQVFAGSSGGLTRNDSVWHRGRGDVIGDLESGASFGAALAAGYFDADGYADLAVGVPGSAAARGEVAVLYGGAAGVTGRDQRWRQGSAGLPGAAEAKDRFGSALVAGDFDGRGPHDLAVAAPRESRSKKKTSGDVTVIPGSRQGLTASGATIWHRGRNALTGSLVAGDRFGANLAAVDVDGDGRQDLVAGATATATSRRGNFQLIYGSLVGLTATGNELVGQDTPGVPGVSQDGDRFGAGLP